MKALVVMEVLVCFGPASFALLLGLVVAPMQFYFLVTRPREGISGELYVVGAVLAGLLGLGVLGYVLRCLFAGRPIRRPRLVVVAVLVALAPLPFFVMYGDTIAYRVMAALPFAGSAHLLYLARVYPTRTD